jgi:hypothetical protein
MQNVYRSYSDPGHGWVRVPIAVLKTLGIADKVTHYSYQRGDYAYLEEDCDMSLFIKAFNELNGRDPVFKHHSGNNYSKIRGYNHYFFNPGA